MQQATSEILNKGNSFNVEQEVRRRYADGARQAEAGLCCPTNYNQRYLELLPSEILEKDYGCGDPSAWVNEGETVLDLGWSRGVQVNAAALFV